MKLMDIAIGLQVILLPAVKTILVFLVVLLILLSVIYILATIAHSKKTRTSAKKFSDLQNSVEALLNTKTQAKKLRILKKDHELVKEYLIKKYSETNEAGRIKITALYKKLGLLSEDLKQVKKSRWWKKIAAIERIGNLQITEAENDMLPLLKNKRDEVRYSALRTLTLIKSESLYKKLPEIFAESSRWAYRYLVNMIYSTDVPAKYIKPMSDSKNRDIRKAAAILFGRKDLAEAIPILKKLCSDETKDVRREAIRSLGRIGTQDAISAVISLADDKNPEVRKVIAGVLCEASDARGLETLDMLAGDSDFDVRLQAIFSLSRMGKKGKDLLSKHRDKYPEMVKEFLA